MEKYSTLQKVKIRLGQFHTEEVTDPDTGITSDVTVFDRKEDNPLIELLLYQNEQLVINASGISSAKKEEYLKKKEEAIVELALYDRNKLGADYSASHSENGITRTWNSKEDILCYYDISWHVKAL